MKLRRAATQGNKLRWLNIDQAMWYMIIEKLPVVRQNIRTPPEGDFEKIYKVQGNTSLSLAHFKFKL